MDLTFKDLKEREVINVPDGRSLGKIINLTLKFPEGILVGITVPGRKYKGILKLFDKSELYIEDYKIVKIGADVILVNLKKEEADKQGGKKRDCRPFAPPFSPCAPYPPCPPNPRPPQPRGQTSNGDFNSSDGSKYDTFGYDYGDY